MALRARINLLLNVLDHPVLSHSVMSETFHGD